MQLKLNLPHPLIVFDTETGGLNASEEVSWNLNVSNIKKGDTVDGVITKVAAPVLEIAAVRLNQHTLEEEAKFYSICGPETKKEFNKFISACSEKALEINGFNTKIKDLKAAPATSKVMQEFVDWLPRTSPRGRPQFIPAGQNVRFDMEMLNATFARHDIDYQFRSHPIDLITCAQLYFSRADTAVLSNYKLATIAEALNVKFKKAHTAVDDVRVTAECLRKILKVFLKIS